MKFHPTFASSFILKICPFAFSPYLDFLVKRCYLPNEEKLEKNPSRKSCLD
jgi:hypothetical protein